MLLAAHHGSPRTGGGGSPLPPHALHLSAPGGNAGRFLAPNTLPALPAKPDGTGGSGGSAHAPRLGLATISADVSAAPSSGKQALRALPRQSPEGLPPTARRGFDRNHNLSRHSCVHAVRVQRKGTKSTARDRTRDV